MIKKNVSQYHFLKTLLVCLAIFLVNVFCLAQNQSDIEVKVQPSSENARSGEVFSYTININNLGSAKAKDVALINEPGSIVEFVSHVPSKGTCRLYNPSYRTNLYCSFDEIDAGETVSVFVEVKIADFGGEYEPKEADKIGNQILETMKKMVGKSQAVSKGFLIGEIDIFPKESDRNKENNSFSLYVNLLPSKNLPPKVEIISPENEATVSKDNQKPFDIQIKIKAFDPDGTISKVAVSGYTIPIVGMISENNQSKYIVWDKTYTVEEMMTIEADYESHNKFIGQFYAEAVNVEKDVFVYTLKNPKYGTNKIHIKATDNGGRIATVGVEFTVKGDSTIELVQPKAKQIFSPNSPITLETVSKLNNGQVKRIYFQKINGFGDNFLVNPTAELVSNEGNIYRHKYVLKNLSEDDAYQTFQATLIEESGAVTKSEPISFLIRNVPKIIFTNLKNGQEIIQDKEVEILFEVTNRNSMDKFEIYLDGKYQGSSLGGYIWINPEKGVHTIQIVSKFDGIELSKSELLTIKIK